MPRQNRNPKKKQQKSATGKFVKKPDTGRTAKIITKPQLDEEEARLQTAIDTDPDAWQPTDEEWKKARPAKEIVPDIVEAYESGNLGVRGPQKSPTKKQITLRLDQDVIDHFKQGGKGWQSRLNEYLKKSIAEEK